MAETKVITLVVEELSKYGFKSNGRYVNYSKQIKESDKVFVVPGAKFEAELYVADSGKEYLNKVLKSEKNPVSLPQIAPYDAAIQKHTKQRTSKEENTMTREDWDAKDVRISRAGVIQAAVQAVGGDFDEAVKLADKMLAYVRAEQK